MRVYVQWATATAADWVAYDLTSARDVRALPRKGAPSGGEVIDDTPGWISGINVQGVVFSGDHVGIDWPGGVLQVATWNDDPDDWPAVPFGKVYTFGPLRAAPELVGIGWDTQQTATPYADTATVQALIAAGLPFDDWLTHPARQPWSAFPRFNPNQVLHGVWVDDALNDEHLAARTPHVYWEWATP